MSRPGVTVSGVVEGIVDDAVLRRLVRGAGGNVGPIHVKYGKDKLDQGIGGYNKAAQYNPWGVLRDLDHDAPCPVCLRKELLPDPSPQRCFRIAVRAVESWLMADCKSIARFLGVPRGAVSADPESLSDPKHALVELAKGSRKRYIREDVVPRPGSGRSVGPEYTAHMIESVQNRWRPEAAVGSSESLSRCMGCLRSLTESGG